MSSTPDGVLGELSSVFWRQRTLLELLLFKLDEEQLVISSRKKRWGGHATREVEIVVEELRAYELRRAVLVSHVVERADQPAPASLAELATAVAEPWRYIFTEHRLAFERLRDEFERTPRGAGDNFSSAARDMLEWLSGRTPRQETDPTAPVVMPLIERSDVRRRLWKVPPDHS